MSMQAAAGNERACDAVIFDVGNVLIRWDARLVYRRLLPDEASIEAFFAEVGFMDWNLEFDRGARWHESVEGAVEGAEALLAELAARGVPLYAITNFAGPKWTESVARFPFLGTSFRDVVVSGHEGVVKPDPEIFRRCLARNRLEARTCVFVDDSPANVAAAAAVGLDAIRFTSVEALHPELARRGLL
jgi:2-haloacid dehalogenase